MENNEEIKTKFQGPGEWRSQAEKLEKETKKDKEE